MADVSLLSLFDPVMRNLMHNCSSADLKSAVQHIKASYSKIHVGTSTSANVVYDHNALRCAYLYLFGPIHTALVSVYLTSLQSKWKEFAEWYGKTVKGIQKSSVDAAATAASAKRRMHVCSLGGGPGLENGCVYVWLETLVKDWIIEHGETGFDALRLTICDVNYEWKHVFYKLLSTFRKHVTDSPTNHAAIGQVELKYVKSDLMQHSLDDATLETVGNSDIVMMVKFLSAVSKQKAQCRVMLGNVIRAMKPGALLLIIDGGHRNNKSVIEAAIARWSLRSVFQHEQYYKADRRFNALWTQTYGEYFAKQVPMYACKIFGTVLQKPYETQRDGALRPTFQAADISSETETIETGPSSYSNRPKRLYAFSASRESADEHDCANEGFDSGDVSHAYEDLIRRLAANDLDTGESDEDESEQEYQSDVSDDQEEAEDDSGQDDLQHLLRKLAFLNTDGYPEAGETDEGAGPIAERLEEAIRRTFPLVVNALSLLDSDDSEQEAVDDGAVGEEETKANEDASDASKRDDEDLDALEECIDQAISDYLEYLGVNNRSTESVASKGTSQPRCRSRERNRRKRKVRANNC